MANSNDCVLNPCFHLQVSVGPPGRGVLRPEACQHSLYCFEADSSEHEVAVAGGVVVHFCQPVGVVYATCKRRAVP